MANSRVALTQTLANRAVTQLSKYNFNSMGRVADQYVGVNEDGLYTIEGDVDSASAIASYFELYCDFGTVVRMRSLWMTFETACNLAVTLTFDDRSADATTFTVTPYQYSNRQQGIKVYSGAHGDKGQFVRVRIANTGGGDFSVDRVVAKVIPEGHRRAQ